MTSILKAAGRIEAPRKMGTKELAARFSPVVLGAAKIVHVCFDVCSLEESILNCKAMNEARELACLGRDEVLSGQLIFDDRFEYVVAGNHGILKAYGALMVTEMHPLAREAVRRMVLGFPSEGVAECIEALEAMHAGQPEGVPAN